MYFNLWITDKIASGFVSCFRWLMFSISSLCYELVIFFYDIFVRLGTAEILTTSQIEKIYSRVTLILGLFMLFKLAFSFVQYLLNPETLSDKSKGAGKIIMKAIIVVVLLGTTPFIFRQAFNLQKAILDSNILGKVILGTNNADSDVSNFGSDLSSYMFFSFYSFYEGETCEYGDIDDMKDEVKLNHTFELAEECLNEKGSSEKYSVNFAGNGVLTLVVGIFVLYIILSYCLSVGMRVIQLAFLQLIAPIPILSYIGEDKEGAFSKWVKRCISTFLDLFIRIAIIYFIVYIINLLMSDSDSYYWLLASTGNPVGKTKFWLIIVIIIGLLFFAKKAPDLFKEILPQGIGNNIGFGFKDTNRLLAGAGGIAAAAGLATVGRAGHTLSRGIKTYKDYQDENGNTFGRGKDGRIHFGKWDNDGNLLSEVKDKDKIRKARMLRARTTGKVGAAGIGSMVTQTGLSLARNITRPPKSIGDAVKKQSAVNAKYRHAIDRNSNFTGRAKEVLSDITGFEFYNSAASLETRIENAEARNAALNSSELSLNNAVKNYGSLDSESLSDLKGDSLDGSSKILQDKYKEFSARVQVTSNLKIGDTYGGSVITSAEQIVKAQSEASQDFADFEKFAKEVRHNFSYAAGHGVKNYTLSGDLAAKASKYGFYNTDSSGNISYTFALDADEASANINRASDHAISDIRQNIVQFRRVNSSGNVVANVVSEGDKLLYKEYDSDGKITKTVDIVDANGLVNYAGLKKVKNLSNAIIGDNYELRSQNDAEISAIKQSEEYMKAQADREAAHTLNDAGLKGGRVGGNGMHINGHRGPGGPPPGP